MMHGFDELKIHVRQIFVCRRICRSLSMTAALATSASLMAQQHMLWVETMNGTTVWKIPGITVAAVASGRGYCGSGKRPSSEAICPHHTFNLN
mmetsp:Transcript_35972/g.86836  ORF Transcript_35972/g.86836 Transcript_35972/m.86836 type:complete len:93 (+) Transcript_35972:2200-2478(+)